LNAKFFRISSPYNGGAVRLQHLIDVFEEVKNEWCLEDEVTSRHVFRGLKGEDQQQQQQQDGIDGVETDELKGER